MIKASFKGVEFQIEDNSTPFSSLKFYGPAYLPETCRDCAENHGDTYRMVCEPSGGDGVVSFSKQEKRVQNMLIDRGNKCFEFQEIVEKTFGYRPCPHRIGQNPPLMSNMELSFTL